MTTTCGTPGYVAPEILAQKGGYGCEVDLWSLGVILYILICGFPPFYDENNSALYNQIKRGDYSFPSPYWDNVSKPAVDIVRKLLTVDAKARLTVQQALEHPWIKGRDENDTVNLAGAQEQLKKFNARRKFKNAVNTVMAVGFSSAAPPPQPCCLLSLPTCRLLSLRAFCALLLSRCNAGDACPQPGQRFPISAISPGCATARPTSACLFRRAHRCRLR
jgi:serine/threonine protein kinase